MQRLEVSGVVRLIYRSLGVKGLMLPFLVHKIFTLYINGVLNCECPATGQKG